MLFVYLLVLILYTGGLSAQNTTLNPEICQAYGSCRGDCTKRWTFCPGKDGVLLCTKKEHLIDPESTACEFKNCPVGEMPDKADGKTNCLPLNRMTNGSLPDGWWWDGCPYQFQVNCGSYLRVCVRMDDLQAYNKSIGGCHYKGGCPPTTHPCQVENGTECIAYDDLKSVFFKDTGFECVRATAEEKAAARATPSTAPLAAQENDEPKPTSSSSPSWHLVNSAFIILIIKLQLR